MSIYSDANNEFVISLTEWCKNNQLDITELGHEKVPGFPGFAGMNHTEETKRIISIHSKGKNNGMYGRTHTEDAIKKIKNARAQQIITEKQKLKIRFARKGQKHSDITKEKMSNSHIGITHTEETKQKLSKLSSKGEYIFISPKGEKYIHHSIVQFAIENNLSKYLLYSFLNKGKIDTSKKGQLSKNGKKTLGWEVRYLQHHY